MICAAGCYEIEDNATHENTPGKKGAVALSGKLIILRVCVMPLCCRFWIPGLFVRGLVSFNLSFGFRKVKSGFVANKLRYSPRFRQTGTHSFFPVGEKSGCILPV